MVKKAKVIDLNNESTTYEDIAEVVQEENEKPEEPPLTEEVPFEEVKPKAKAKRTPKAKPLLERTDSNMVVAPEPQQEPQEAEEPEEPTEPTPKPKAKRAARLKVVDSPPGCC